MQSNQLAGGKVFAGHSGVSMASMMDIDPAKTQVWMDGWMDV